MRNEIWIAVFALGMIAAALAALSIGCTTLPTVTDLIPTNAVPGTATTTTTTTTTTQPAQYDMTLRVTSLTEHQVGFDWTPRDYGWPRKMVKVWCDAEVHMHRADGSGGKFDWIREGGQASKGLENIRNGYGGHTIPAPGERVTFRWVSVDGKKRSNDAEATWPAKRWWRFWE
jgi:hypothetical protein